MFCLSPFLLLSAVGAWMRRRVWAGIALVCSVTTALLAGVIAIHVYLERGSRCRRPEVSHGWTAVRGAPGDCHDGCSPRPVDSVIGAARLRSLVHICMDRVAQIHRQSTAQSFSPRRWNWCLDQGRFRPRGHAGTRGGGVRFRRSRRRRGTGQHVARSRRCGTGEQ